jgi:hypothetical protein
MAPIGMTVRESIFDAIHIGKVPEVHFREEKK